MTVPFNIAHFLCNCRTSLFPTKCTFDCNAPVSAVNCSHP